MPIHIRKPLAVLDRVFNIAVLQRGKILFQFLLRKIKTNNNGTVSVKEEDPNFML